MIVSDLLFKIFVPLFSACLGAILAFRYQRTIEIKRDKRLIIQTLMRYRNVLANELEWIKALNVIDIIFCNDKKVIELYHTFLAQTQHPIFENKQFVETYYQLIFQMAQCSDYKNLTLQDIRDFYSPEALKFHYPNRNVVSELLPPMLSDLPKTN